MMPKVANWKDSWSMLQHHDSKFVLPWVCIGDFNETLHYLRSKRTGKMGYMSLKLDMSKAYNQVEWVYLKKIMEKMGFNRR